MARSDLIRASRTKVHAKDSRVKRCSHCKQQYVTPRLNKSFLWGQVRLCPKCGQRLPKKG